MKQIKPVEKEYLSLIESIGNILKYGRKHAYQAVNTILVRTYWEIGRRIAEYESLSGEDAAYGSKLFERIVSDLRQTYGKGFSRSNVIYMRLSDFALLFFIIVKMLTFDTNTELVRIKLKHQKLIF